MTTVLPENEMVLAGTAEVRAAEASSGAGEKKKKGLTLTRKFVPKSPVAEFEATDFEAALLHYRQWKKEQGEHVQDG